jgi:AcrR family transcriptional regulator
MTDSTTASTGVPSRETRRTAPLGDAAGGDEAAAAAPLTPTQERTRRALLMAGIEVLGTDPSAPLSEISARAGVARSTLHRYFADRDAIVEAIMTLARAEWKHAIEAARLDDGTGLEALRRLVLELMDRLNILQWWLSPHPANADDRWDDELVAEWEREVYSGKGHSIWETARRGHADGSIDPAMDPEWIEILVWGALRGAHEAAGSHTLTPASGRALALTTFLKAASVIPH